MITIFLYESQVPILKDSIFKAKLLQTCKKVSGSLNGHFHAKIAFPRIECDSISRKSPLYVNHNSVKKKRFIHLI